LQFPHSHLCMVVTKPRMTRGIRQIRDEDGTLVAEQLVIEGLADVVPIGVSSDCRLAEESCRVIDEAIADPYDSIVDGDIVFLCMN
jgi:hypothetical protein